MVLTFIYWYIHKPLFCYLFPINRTFRYLRYPNTEVTGPRWCFMSLPLGQSKRNTEDSASTLFRENLILFLQKINAFLKEVRVSIEENKTCDKYFRIFAIGDTEKRHSSLGT